MSNTHAPRFSSLSILQGVALLTLSLIVLQFLWAGISLFGGLPGWGIHKDAGFAVMFPLGCLLVCSKHFSAIAGLRGAAWTVAGLYILQVVLAIVSKSPELGWLKAAHLANGPLLLLAAHRLYQQTRLSR